MRSKNKPKQTKAEAQHVAHLTLFGCVVCGDEGPIEVHEPEQGYWWISVPLCAECHRGKDGWHGTRLRWKLRKMDELKAINTTLERVYG